MAIRVTLMGILDDFWGADECFEAGGQTAVRELIEEDLSALMENLSLKIERVDGEGTLNPKSTLDTDVTNANHD